VIERARRTLGRSTDHGTVATWLVSFLSAHESG
jgi:hypothetical protein